MLSLPVGREAGSGVAAPPNVRHRPERTLLYQLVEEYYLVANFCGESSVSN